MNLCKGISLRNRGFDGVIDIGAFERASKGGSMSPLILVLILASAVSVTYAQSGLPDLIVDSSRLQSSIFLKTEIIRSSGCAYAEGCVAGTGKRKLLKFDTAIANIGTADVVLGNPASHPELYEWSACHGHYHLKAATIYELLSLDMTTIVAGRKNAFCFLDGSRYDPNAGPSSGYNCSNQGITSGWQDVYFHSLDCQWIDVTGVPTGNYILKVTVNQNGLIGESNYSNNSAFANVKIAQGKKN